ncbi:hypothetical protein AAKU55_003367 [Oxalobacteraceae bacterium GrIS 1.11]
MAATDLEHDAGRRAVEAHFAEAQRKLERLRQVEPLLLDVSLREACSSSPLGHTLQNKLDLLALVDGFGLQQKIIATLNYQFETDPQVEDDFCRHLRDSGYDLAGCFALTSIGTLRDGVFVPDASMRKLVEYGIPHTVHEFSLEGASLPLLLETLSASIAWLRANGAVTGAGDGVDPSRIYINLIDLPDVFFGERELACAVLRRLADENVDAVSFEDGRGTFFPFQIGAIVGALKAMLKPAQKVLLHIHAGNGMENAAVIEALLQGADGYWAGMARGAAMIGHASLGELIASLARAGNPHMAQRYQLPALVPVCHAIHHINTGQGPAPDWPVFGAHAYRQMLSCFDQIEGRFMDLAPAAIGAWRGFRIAPVGSDIAVLQGRVLEALQLALDEAGARRMILLMRDDLRRGLRLEYDAPDQLAELLRRAGIGE